MLAVQVLQSQGLTISQEEMQQAYDRAFREVVTRKFEEALLRRRRGESSAPATPAAASETPAATPPSEPPAATTPAAASQTQAQDTDDGTRSPMVLHVLMMGCYPWLFLVGGRPHRLRPHAPEGMR